MSLNKRYFSRGSLSKNIFEGFCAAIGFFVLLFEFRTSGQWWLVPLIAFSLALALYAADQILTPLAIVSSARAIRIAPKHPLSFQRRFSFERSNIKSVKVVSESTISRYGKTTVHTVVLSTKDGSKYHVVATSDKDSAIEIKKFLSSQRYA